MKQISEFIEKKRRMKSKKNSNMYIVQKKFTLQHKMILIK